MTESQLLPSVVGSLETILAHAQPGDILSLLTFDLEAKFHFKWKVKDESTRTQFIEKVKTISALGQWTNLIGALDLSFKRATESFGSHPDQKNLILLYTDGVHHLPPWIRKKDRTDFDDLYLKHYAEGPYERLKSQGKSAWFVYYIELDKGDTDLKRFLSQTESGTLVSKQEFRPALNFLKPIHDQHPSQWDWLKPSDEWLAVIRKIGLGFGFIFFLVWFFSNYRIVKREQ